MAKIRIVTDSTCSLPPELISQYGITVVPYAIQFANESYRDGVDIDVEQFDEKVRSEGDMPKTAIPSPGEFAEVYQALAEQADTVISIHAGKKVSGICGSAELGAAEVPEVQVEVVDSNIVCMPMGFMVLEAAKAAEAGKTKDEILAIIEEVKENTGFFATSVELEFIKESGRIVGAGEAADSAVKVKPIIQILDGEVLPVENVRTKRKALRRLIELVQALGPLEEVAIIHSSNVTEAQETRQRMAPLRPVDRIPIVEAGPVLGTHAGPGAVGIACVLAQTA